MLAASESKCPSDVSEELNLNPQEGAPLVCTEQEGAPLVCTEGDKRLSAQTLLKHDAQSSNDGETSSHVKTISLVLLVLQNSGIFLLMRYTRMQPGPKYLATVVVFVTETAKLLLCASVVLIQTRGRDLQLVWSRETLRLCVPALCYTIQNNLLFVAVANLSAAASQVLYQSKTLSTALFSVILLKKRFTPCQWISFLLLAFGVVVVQSQDRKSAAAPPPGSQPLVGLVASICAAGLSGFAGVYLELMFNKGNASLWVRNVQLAIFTVPLQAFTIVQTDLHAVRRHGLFVGFHASTWGVVAMQVAGGIIVAVVIKYAGNILKTFAAVLAILCTCIMSVPLFGSHPTSLFWVGVAIVCTSIWLYARPPDKEGSGSCLPAQLKQVLLHG